MGDGADVIGQQLNREYDDGYYAFERRDPDNVTCSRCGATGLSWYNVGIDGPQWRLYTGRGTRLAPHVCPTERRHQIIADDFEDES